MRVRFWGTRGSIATPGPGTIHFGGNTSCVELTTASGDLLIFDCGTGARGLAAELMTRGMQAINANILLGHTHWDHIQGFPFFTPAFVNGNSVAIFGPEGSRGPLRDVLAGQMEYTYFPIDLNQLPGEDHLPRPDRGHPHDRRRASRHAVPQSPGHDRGLPGRSGRCGDSLSGGPRAVFRRTLARRCRAGPHRIHPARRRSPTREIHGRRRPRDPRRAVHARGVSVEEDLGTQHVQLRGTNCRSRRRTAGRTDPPRSGPRRPIHSGDRTQGPQPCPAAPVLDSTYSALSKAARSSWSRALHCCRSSGRLRSRRPSRSADFTSWRWTTNPIR